MQPTTQQQQQPQQQQQQCPPPTPAAPPPKQQLASTPYGKVAAWLNGSYSRSAPTKPRSGPGPPLLTRFSSSLLWYAGLGSALHSQQHRAAGMPGQQHHPSANAGAAAAARPGVNASPSVTPPAASKQGLPLHGQGGATGSSSSSSGPASHPLTLQQIEQSMEFSTSSSSAGGAAATAPAVQAVSKGRWLGDLGICMQQVLSSCCVQPCGPVSLEQQCAVAANAHRTDTCIDARLRTLRETRCVRAMPLVV
jgi:hypothetical protein